MSVFDLMARLGAAGIRLWLEDGQLRFKGPKGAMTAELKQAVVAQKADIIAFLQETRRGQVEPLPVADRQCPIPLSSAQSRLWFVEQLMPGTPTFHVAAALRFRGAGFYVPALEAALTALAARHEALRTVFTWQAEAPVQIIQAPATVTVAFDSLPLEAAELEAQMNAAYRQPFDLEHGPLMRVHCWCTGADEHVLLLVMHHLVTDGWSMQIIVQELVQAYLAAQQGLQPPWPALPRQYADFSAWQQLPAQQQQFEKQLDYWRARLAGAPELLPLPWDFARPELPTGQGAAVSLVIEDAVSQQVRDMAKGWQTTPYTVLLAAFVGVLARWSGQEDISVGMPVAGRSHPQTEAMVGFFVNQLVIRGAVTPMHTFEQLVAQLREHILAAQAHQDVPFEQVVDALGVARDPGYSPLFQTSLSLTPDTGAKAALAAGGLTMTPLELPVAGARFDLTLMLVDAAAGFRGMLEYNTDLFTATTAQLFVSHFERFLEAALAVPQQPLAALALWSDQEVLAHLHGWPHATAATVSLDHTSCQPVSGPEAADHCDAAYMSVVQLPLPAALLTQAWREAVEHLIASQSRCRQGYWSSQGLPAMASWYRLTLPAEAVIDARVDECEYRGTFNVNALPPLNPARPFSWTLVTNLDSGARVQVLRALRWHCEPDFLLALGRTAAATGEIHSGVPTEASTTEPSTRSSALERRLSAWLEAEDIGVSTEHHGALKTACFTLPRGTKADSWWREALITLVRQTHYESARILWFARCDELSGVLNAAVNGEPGQSRWQPQVVGVAPDCLNASLLPAALTLSQIQQILPQDRLLIFYEHVRLDTTETMTLGLPALQEHAMIVLQLIENDHGTTVTLHTRGVRCHAGLCVESLKAAVAAAEPQRAQLTAPAAVGATDESFLDSIVQQARLRPQAVAVRCGHQQQTYAELVDLSERLAQTFSRHPAAASQPQRVMIAVAAQIALPAVILGAIRAGAAYIPVDVNYPVGRRQFMLDDSAPTWLVVDAIDPELNVPAGCTQIKVADLLAAAADTAERALRVPEPDQILYLLYTSGSTGQPKAALIRHRAETNLLRWYTDSFPGLNSDDCVFLPSALGFDLSQKNLFAPLCVGATLVLPQTPQFDAAATAAALIRWGVTLINCAPSMLLALLEQPELHADYCPLRAVVLGGEAIPVGAIDAWLAQHPQVQLVNSYGPTECTDVVCAASFDASTLPAARELESLPMGAPIPGVTLTVVNSRRESMLPGAVGELCISGVAVGAGYWQRPELNDAVFANSRYYTGDLVMVRPDGQLCYMRRRDFQLKVRGLRIEPAEIEAALQQLAQVIKAQLLVVNDQLIAFVEINADITVEALKQQLARSLPAFMIPARILFLTEWPLTPNGKLDRAAMVTLAEQGTGVYVAPATELETALAQLWADVLELDDISVTANFFELGGHSLLATRLVARLQRQLHIDISVSQIFTAPTVRALAETVAQGQVAQASGVDSAPAIVPAQPPNRRTLSFAQYRLWFVDQLHEGTPEYNIPAAMRIFGPLDVDVMARVLTTIVTRHEVLRTNFISEGGEPLLRVHAPFAWSFPVEDLTQMDTRSRQAAVARAVDAEANRVLSLETDTLMQVRLLRVGAEEWVLLFNLHHIIFDGWSHGILLQEIEQLYVAYRRGRENPLPPLPIQYADFAQWQREWLQGAVLAQLQTYWREQLAGAPSFLPLPTDRPRPSVPTTAGAHLPITLGRTRTQRIQAFAQARGLSVFMVLQAGFHLLLARYTGQLDICSGTPVAGRSRVETEAVIGFFINAIVIRSRLEDNPTVDEYLAQMKTTVLAGLAHQDMPADLLLDAMKLERRNDIAPGAQVGLALQNVTPEQYEAQVADLRIVHEPRQHTTAKYEWSFILQEQAGELRGVIEYNTDLFDVETVARARQHFIGLLDAMLAHPEHAALSLPMLGMAEIAMQLGLNPVGANVQRLTPMQRDMFLDHQRHPDTLKDSHGYYFFVDAPFSVERWQRAFAALCAEEPLMQCRIIESSQPWLDVAYRVDNAAAPVLEQLDWRGQALSSAAVAARIEAMIYQPWSLDGPLCWARLIQVDTQRWCCAFSMHHILVDGEGLALHLQRWVQWYEALALGQQLPAPTAAFDTYVTEQMQRVDAAAAQAYWRRQVLTQPVWARTEAQRQAAVQRVERKQALAPAQWRAVQRWCRSQRVSPALFFRSLYGLMVQLYCQPEGDFCIHEVLSGRGQRWADGFGNFYQIRPHQFVASTLADTQLTVAEFCQQERQRWRQQQRAGQLSWMTLRQLLPTSAPEFFYNYYHFIPALSLAGQSLELTICPSRQSEPVQFVVAEHADFVELTLIYDQHRFSEERWLERLVALIEQTCGDAGGKNECQPHLSLNQLRWLLADESAVLFGAPAPTPPLELLKGFVAQLDQRPHACALRAGAERFSFSELAAHAAILIQALAERGTGPGDAVMLLHDAPQWWLAGMLATVYVGAHYVPVDHRYPAERIQLIANDCEAVAVVASADQARLLEAGVSAGLVVPELMVETQWPPSAAQAAPTAGSALYLIYTSGSTGRPKGASVSRHAAANLVQWYAAQLDWTPADSVAIVSALGFDLTQKNLWLVLSHGGCLHFDAHSGFDPAATVRAITREQVNLVNCAPTQFLALIEQGLPAHVLRWAVLGGEPIDVAALTPWMETGTTRILNSYGPTECTDVVLATELQRPLAPAAGRDLGTPLPAVAVQVLDAQLRPVPPGVPGELWLGGGCVGLGYHAQPDLTAEKFISLKPDQGDSHWFRTGDRVRLERGSVHYLGRLDAQLKLRGLRIEPGEIERALQQVDGIDEVVVWLINDQLVAYYLGQSLPAASLRAALLAQLPDFMVPHSYCHLEHWPLNAHGKIERSALPAPLAAEAEYVAAETPTEQRLTRLWQELLGIDEVSVTASFFELGGHSLLAARAIALLRTEFDVEISLRALFEYHTIREIGRYLDTLKWAELSAKRPESTQSDAGPDRDEPGRDEGWL